MLASAAIFRAVVAVLAVTTDCNRAPSRPSKGPSKGRALLQHPSDKIADASQVRGQPDAASPMVVKLQKVPLRPLGEAAAEQRHAYIGNVTVGYPPQRMRVLFDTSSGNVLLPHRVCQSKACKEHQRYSSQQSHTSEDVDFNGSRVQKQHRLAVGRVLRDSAYVEWTSADLGTGTSKAVLVSDKVCMKGVAGEMACAWPAINVALTMDDVPFRAMPSDGIVGLGLLGLSGSPTCSFFNTLIQRSPALKPLFGVSFGQSEGELQVGGYDATKFAAPLQWFPVHSPTEGYWQVPIHGVRIGNVTVDACERSCHAIIDTSASRLGVQASNLPRLQQALRNGLGGPLHCVGSDLEFDLGGMTIKMGSEDYTNSKCEPDLGSLDLDEPDFTGVYAFGESVLRHYFVAFQWKELMVGFAPLQNQHHHGVLQGKVEQIFM